MRIFDFIFRKKTQINREETHDEIKYYGKGPYDIGKIYLNVPYSEKDRAKAMGARWDAEIKKWYYKGLVKNYTQFAKWISDDSEMTVAFEKIYLVERKRKCYRCGKQTGVVGLALGEHMIIYRDENGIYKSDYYQDKNEIPNLYVTWYLCESDIPAALLEYIKSNYNVHIGRSKAGGVYFANHCEHCDTIQGSNYLTEEDTGFLHQTDEAIEELKKHTIYSIKIDEDIHLDWNVGYSGYEYVYCKYGQVKELKLPQSKRNNDLQRIVQFIMK